MIGAGFRVVLNSGRTFHAANHLTTARRNVDGAPMLHFMAEGTMWSVQADMVKGIEWTAVQQTQCSECRRDLANETWAARPVGEKTLGQQEPPS